MFFIATFSRVFSKARLTESTFVIALPMLTLQELLVDTPDDPPCGSDLSYHADFLAMESAARGKTEQQFGDTVIAAEAPDWRLVERQAIALMQRTKDLRVCILLCRSWTQLKGIPGAAQGLQLISDLLERHWEQLHPELEEDGDCFMRMNALATLNEVTGFVRELRDAEFLRTSLGMVHLRDAEALAKGATAEGIPSLSGDQLRMAVVQARTEGHENLQALDDVAKALACLEDSCTRFFPNHQKPELGSLRQLLQSLQYWQPHPSKRTDDSGPIPTAATALPVSAGSPELPTMHREQLIDHLLEIAALVERTEPANPAPLLIRRAARFMKMGFLDILRELSPESLPQVEAITGASVHTRQP